MVKIDLATTHSLDYVGIKAEVERRLVLTVNLHLTDGGSPAAVSARIVAYRHYVDAVEISPWGNEKDHPRMLPRSGDLIVWEEEVLWASSGTTRDLVTSVSQGIEQHMKKFFTDYLKAQY